MESDYKDTSVIVLVIYFEVKPDMSGGVPILMFKYNAKYINNWCYK